MYLAPLARWGNHMPELQYRRMHWRRRQMAGNVVKKPSKREWLESHLSGSCHARL